MKTLIRTLALAGMTACTSLVANAGEATVTFTHPEKFADFGYFQVDREELQKVVADHFIKKAARLPANQSLKIEVLDADMAGEFRRGKGTTPDLRLVRGHGDGPSMVVRFTLTENGHVIKSGEEMMSDVSYMQRINYHFKGDDLRYEKQMVDDWFRQRLGVNG